VRSGSRKAKKIVDYDRKPLEPILELAEPASMKEKTDCSGAFCSGKLGELPEFRIGATMKAMKGSKVTLGLTTIAADSRKQAIEFEAIKFDDMPLAVASSGAAKLSVPVKIVSPDGVEKTGTIELGGLTFLDAFRKRLSKVTDGPVTVDNDQPTPKPPRSLYWSYDAALFGHGATVRELDLVALTTKKHRALSCGTYRGQTTGREVTISRDMTDAEVVVYDRRTAKVVTKKTFLAPIIGCPDTTSSQFALSSDFDEKPIKTWLTTLVAK
jgi:hypothetical protein